MWQLTQQEKQIMYMNKPDRKPGDERQILIAIDVSGTAEFTTGWYDFHEGDYYTDDGEMIEMSDMIAWDEKPTIEFLAI